MFLTNEKKKHSTWQGTFYTRKWNDQTPVVYFEKLYGGRPLLKKINQLALQENLIFNSSMVDENNATVWQSAGWEVSEKLNVLSLNLKNIKQSDKNIENVEVFTDAKIPEVLNLDHNIFDPYWQNSIAAFKETLESCVHNYLFIQKAGGDTAGYGILGITRNHGFLQRLGIVAQMRAIESGRPMLRATNEGVTAHIGSRGEILKSLPNQRVDTLTGQIQPRQGHTPYLWIGPYPALFVALLTLIYAGLTVPFRRRQR